MPYPLSSGKIKQRQLESEALRYRAAGWTPDAIAERLGLEGAAHANILVKKALKRLKDESAVSAEEIVQVEVEKIRALEKRLEDKLDSQVEAGHLDPALVNSRIKLMERLSKLLGLDKPVRHEHDVRFGMTRIEADNSSDRRIAVQLLMKCAIELGDNPMDIAREAVSKLPEYYRPAELAQSNVVDVQLIEDTDAVPAPKE